MSRRYELLRAGFPYVKSLGMRRVTNYPVDVAVAPEGKLYVVTAAGDIARLNWDDDGSWDVGDLLPIGGAGTDDGKFTWPANIVMDRDQDLWVSDEALHRITVMSTDGEFIDKWGDHGDGDGQLDRPSGIAFDANEDLYVVDTLNHRVQKFTKQGKFLMKWGNYGQGDGEFDMPWGVTVDGAGDVYVVDWRNDRVQKFTADGEFIFAFGESGGADGQFNRPAGIAVDGHGDIYVADCGNDRVHLFDADGRYVEKFIGDGTLSKMARDYMMTNARPNRLRDMAVLEPQKRLHSPKSVRVDDQFRMCIADYGTYRVQVYQKEAIPLDEHQITPPPRSPSLQVT